MRKNFFSLVVRQLYCYFFANRINGKYTEDVITELVKRTWWYNGWENKWWAAPYRLYKKFIRS